MKRVLRQWSGIFLSMALVMGLVPGTETEVRAYDNNPYEELVLEQEDDADTVAGKKVSFGGLEWYIIEDNSTGAEEGTLTLFSAECIGDAVPFNGDPDSNNGSIKYSECSIKEVVGAFTKEGGVLADVTVAIKSENITTMNLSGDAVFDTVDNVRCYLLDIETARKLPAAACKNKAAKGSFLNGNEWWLRSPGVLETPYSVSCATISGSEGDISDRNITKSLGIRPALTLDLSCTVFSAEKKEFTIKTNEYSVVLTGGANADVSGGDTTQTGLTGGPMTDVAYTANSGFHFEPFAEFSDNGVTVKRVSDKVVTVSGTPRGNVSLSVPDAVYDGNPYVAFIPKEADDAEVLAGKQVFFNGIPWYLIEDGSTSPTAGTVTLLSVNPVDAGRYNLLNDCSYNSSEIKQKLDRMTTDETGRFYSVAGAIAGTDLTDENVTGAKLYLISIEEAKKLPLAVRKCREHILGYQDAWWLRSRGGNLGYSACVSCSGGVIDEYGLDKESVLSIRPALRLDLSAVSFSTGTHFFSFGAGYSVILTGGKNANSYGGNTSQTGLTGAMKEVGYRAHDGYEFAPFEPITQNGITLRRTDTRNVTVSGTPTDNVHITIPDAVKPPAVVTKPPEASILAYNGQPHDLVTEGEASGGTMYYAVTGDEDSEPDEGVYSDRIPQMTDAGKYQVWYMAKGDDTHKNSATEKISVTIKKAEAQSIDNISVSRSVHDTSIFTVSLSGRMPSDAGILTYEAQESVSDGSTVVSDFSVDTDGNVTAKITGSAVGDKVTLPVIISSDNYMNSSVNVLITFVDKVAVEIPNPVSGLKWTGKEQTGVNPGEGYTLSGNKGTAVGEYKARASLVNKDTHVWKDDSTEDKDISWSIGKAVGPAAPTGLKGVAPSEKNGNDGRITGVSSDMEYSAEIAPDSWTVCTGTEITGLAPGKYRVRIREIATNEASEYAAVEVPDFSVSAPVITKVPKAVEGLVYNGSAQVLITAGEVVGGILYYAVTNTNTAPEQGIYATMIPTATDAGTYYVWYKIIGDSKHGDTEAKMFAVQIAEKNETDDPNNQDPIITPAPAAPVTEEAAINEKPVKIEAEFTYPQAVTWTGKKITKEQLGVLADNGQAVKVTITGLADAIANMKKNTDPTKLYSIVYDISGKDVGSGTFTIKIKLNNKALKKAKIKGDDKTTLVELVNKLNEDLAKDVHSFKVAPIDLSNNNESVKVTIKATLKKKKVQVNEEDGTIKGLKSVTITYKVPAGKNKNGKQKYKTQKYTYKKNKVNGKFVINVTDAAGKKVSVTATADNQTFSGTRTDVMVKK